MLNTEVNLQGYVTTFHIGKSNGVWKAWTEFNGKKTQVRYCLNKKHAERTRNYMVEKFWGFRLN